MLNKGSVEFRNIFENISLELSTIKYLRALEILLISAGAKFDAAGVGGLRHSSISIVLHAFPHLSLLVICCTQFTVLFISGRNLVEE